MYTVAVSDACVGAPAASWAVQVAVFVTVVPITEPSKIRA